MMNFLRNMKKHFDVILVSILVPILILTVFCSCEKESEILDVETTQVTKQVTEMTESNTIPVITEGEPETETEVETETIAIPETMAIFANTEAVQETALETAKDTETDQICYTETEAVTTEWAEPYRCIGKFKLTEYCPCWICSEGYGCTTATGSTATAWRTIAVDPSVIPYGTEVMINGHTYVAEDCGGGIRGNRIDVYFDDHQDAEDFGVQYADVYICEN